MRIVRTSFVLLSLAIAAGCGDDSTPTGPSGPTTDLSIARVELFQATLAPRGSAFYSFSVLADRGVSMMLATLTDANGAPMDVPLVLGFGVPQGTGCGVTRSLQVTPALQAQLFNGTPIGTYCVNIEDPGNLSAPANFTIRIRQEPTPQPDAAPGTVTFASQLAVGGATTRTFNASRPGTVNLTLDSLSPSGTTVGLGLGLPRVDGSGCIPSRVVQATSGGGPHLSMPVDIGTYCVRVFDLGTLTAPAAFSITISHP